MNNNDTNKNEVILIYWPHFRNCLIKFSKDLPMSDDLLILKKLSFPNFWRLFAFLKNILFAYVCKLRAGQERHSPLDAVFV